MDEFINHSEIPIDGVALHALKVISDARGAVLHMLRADSPAFERFGEIYFSEVNPHIVKGWKRHSRITQRLVVPVGRVKFAIYDDRIGSLSRGTCGTCILGRPDNYSLLIIPPGLWYGFQCLAEYPSLIANCADHEHDPVESEMISLESGLVPFRW